MNCNYLISEHKNKMFDNFDFGREAVSRNISVSEGSSLAAWRAVTGKGWSLRLRLRVVVLDL